MPAAAQRNSTWLPAKGQGQGGLREALGSAWGAQLGVDTKSWASHRTLT